MVSIRAAVSVPQSTCPSQGRYYHMDTLLTAYRSVGESHARLGSSSSLPTPPTRFSPQMVNLCGILRAKRSSRQTSPYSRHILSKGFGALDAAILSDESPANLLPISISFRRRYRLLSLWSLLPLLWVRVPLRVPVTVDGMATFLAFWNIRLVILTMATLCSIASILSSKKHAMTSQTLPPSDCQYSLPITPKTQLNNPQ